MDSKLDDAMSIGAQLAQAVLPSAEAGSILVGSTKKKRRNV